MMKMTSSNRMVIAIVVIVAIAAAFWIMLLSPKREEAAKLEKQVEELSVALVQSQSAVSEAEAARQQFPRNYEQLVVLGKAVPATDETSSLLVELNHVAKASDVKFESLQFGSTDGAAAPEASPEVAPPAPTPGSEGTTGVPASSVAPTEAAAALQPIGASVGPAGLSVLPYDLTFSGTFFDVADFMQGIDSLVKPGSDKVAVDGRLVTLDGFALNGDSDSGFPTLDATFSVTTYLVPPSQGVTAGATESAPAATPTEESSTTPEPR
jgi:Tfp pilus assembly protein PilO